MSLSLLLIGLLVGFAGGLFGKGGSAVATPLLQLAGVPAFFAVASPLPATIPGTLVASLAYLKEGLYDRQVVLWSVLVGVPATVAGALTSHWVGGTALLLLSNLVIAGLGLSFLLHPTTARVEDAPLPAGTKRTLSAAVGLVVGFLSGLLANAGGFLLAPLYARILRLPLKTAFACSLVASAALAVPGTIVHVALGHVSWRIVLVFGLGSIPLSYLGARTAVRMNIKVLEPIFGLVLLVIGALGAADSLGWRIHL
ncbi:MAG TPA: sulfite exporter TauE/SafE family protein [Holophagaceae bacterium]